MLILGHITYSNCYPVHAAIITGKVNFPFRIVDGIPTELNRYLLQGAVDVSPSSSIEYAIHNGKYFILPELSITSQNKSMSILLESRFDLDGLHEKTVALTSASATSVVLLRIILNIFYKVHPEFIVYDQGRDDPYSEADAVLTIGDLALKKGANPAFPYVYDLGEIWNRHTGLPFVFALWQVNPKKGIEQDISWLYDILCESKKYGFSHLRELAEDGTGIFGISADVLLRYWQTLSFDFGSEEQRGLLAYYRYAVELGVIKSVPELHIWRKGALYDAAR